MARGWSRVSQYVASLVEQTGKCEGISGYENNVSQCSDYTK
jgi:hypothetical protein